MPKDNRPPFLRVVNPATLENAPSLKPEAPDWRRDLFASAQPNLMVFVKTDELSEADFLSPLLAVRPKFVFDLRIAPRFDIGSLSRKSVFSIFDQIGARYFDLAGRLSLRTSRDAMLNPALLSGELRTLAFKGESKVEGPLFFLVSQAQFDPMYENALADNLADLADGGWDIVRVPVQAAVSTSPQHREIIFISHATPEDNDIAVWLAAHLSNLGYSVWSDLSKLKAGDKFFDDIEDVIRNRAARVIVCLSKSAQTKHGVLDEISLAITVERTLSLDNFVVPIIIDDLPFDQVRANLQRKHIINFSRNWADGFKELVSSFDRDHVRKNEFGISQKAFASLIRRAPKSVIVDKPEPLFANWLSIHSWPSHINVVEFDGPVLEIEKVRKLTILPTFSYLRLILTFATTEEMQASLPPEVVVKTRCRPTTERFRDGYLVELPGLNRKTARNALTHLSRSAWDKRAAQMGLSAYKLSNGNLAWYPTLDLIEDGVVQYIGPENIKRRKQLVGRSAKRNVYWHFAVEAAPLLLFPERFVLKPHVIFSEDGKQPIVSNSRMHALRRGFCKSWWNDRWRDLIAGYASWFSEFGTDIALPFSESASLHISARLMELTAPMSLASVEQKISVEDGSNVEWLEDPDLDESELYEPNISMEADRRDD